ncbi:DUF1129 family protein [Bacillus sp. T3]|uniref:DUF1129 family protein n=1 Tax=Bacillus sp. T3 TaxID=467262 RepID=UPI002982B63C|nr:DUF1129 family protein [Bacillus sp. T3]
MLSKEAEQFLVELRLYLISKGKNDNEINEITEELEDHLFQAEQDGKDIKEIIGESPKQYMKSIGHSMKTDFPQMLLLLPMTILLLAAYFSIGPAIEGHFSLSKEILILAVIAGMLGVAIYGLFLFKVIPKVYQSKWGYFLLLATFIMVTGLGVVLLFWYKKQGFEPTYVATPVQNNVIAISCAIIFIASALYTKTWITILIPLFTSIGPLANRLLPEEINKNPTYILYTVLLFFVITGLIIFVLIRKRKIREMKENNS